MYVGLIATDWGGTAIELWSSPDSLAKCGVNKYIHLSWLVAAEM